VKVADFGISKRAETESALQTVVGTPEFFAPELMVADKNSSYTNAVDIWALGITVFFAFTGRTVFDRYNLPDVRRDSGAASAHINDSLSCDELSHCSQSCRDFISRLLAVTPAERPTATDCLQLPWQRSLRQDTVADALSSFAE
jgi:serine/threonine protein kinase